MEDELFHCTESETLENSLILCLYNVTLKVKIGKWAKGQFFTEARLNYELGELEFYDSQGAIVSQHKLSLKID